jgi:hypothetical protein
MALQKKSFKSQVLALPLALIDRIFVFIPGTPITMGLFSVPELNTRLGTWRAYHLAAIVL